MNVMCDFRIMVKKQAISGQQSAKQGFYSRHCGRVLAAIQWF